MSEFSGKSAATHSTYEDHQVTLLVLSGIVCVRKTIQNCLTSDNFQARSAQKEKVL